MRVMKAIALCAAVLSGTPIVAAEPQRVFYAAPDGTADAPCTASAPGTLLRAVERCRQANVRGKDFASGSTVLLRDGTYAFAGQKPTCGTLPGAKTPSFVEFNFADGYVTIRPERDGGTVVLLGEGTNRLGRCLGTHGMFRIEDLTFRNFATEGSAAAVSGILNGGARFALVNCRFENCRAKGRGGALAGGRVAGCTFVGCASDDEGGAACAGPGSFFTNCRFENCRARGDGGALRLFGSHILYPAVTNCAFVSCRSEYGAGGAIYVTADSRGKVPIIDCTFKDNFATLRAPASNREIALGWSDFPYANSAVIENGSRYSGSWMHDYGRKDRPSVWKRMADKGYVNTVTVRPGDDLAKARDLLRAQRDPDGRAEVVFEDGVYEITNRLELSEWDAKTTWRARHPGKAVFVGGRAFRGADCRPLEAGDPLAARIPAAARGKVVTLEVPECLRTNFLKRAFAGGQPVQIGEHENYNGFESNQTSVWGPKYPAYPVLSVDTHMMVSARWPNVDEEKLFLVAQTNIVVQGGKGTNVVVRIPDGRIASWDDEDPNIGIWGFLAGCVYGTGRSTVKSIDCKAGTFSLPSASLKPWGRLAIFNVMEELDAPCEWCYDRRSGRIALYPPEGFSEDSLVALGVSGDSFFRVRGSDITIEGFKFTAKHSHPAVILEGGERNVLAGCRFSGLEYEPVFMSGRDCRVQSCDFTELNAAGVRFCGGNAVIGDRGGNVVENCRVWDVCRMKSGWATGGIFLTGGYGNAIRHCQVNDSLEHAIDYWGFDHIVEYNRVYDCSYQFGDTGAVYSQGGSCSFGCTFRYNDISSAPGYVNCLYYDDTTSGHRIYGNVCRGYGCIGIYIGGGRDNLVSNNVVCAADGCGLRFDERGLFWPAYLGANTTNLVKYLKQRYRLDDPESPIAKAHPDFRAFVDDPKTVSAPINNRWINNIVIDVKSEFATWQGGGMGIKLKPSEYESRGNLGIRTTGPLSPKDWRRAWYLGGLTVIDGSTNEVYDTGFVDIPPLERKTKRRYAWRKGNFNLKKGAKVLEACPGFQPIPWDKIGLYKDKWRTELP